MSANPIDQKMINTLVRDVAELKRQQRASRSNQIQLMQVGNLLLDGREDGIIALGENQEILLNAAEKRMLFKNDDGVYQIMIDAANGVIKTSQDGVDVRSATNSQLTFLSTYRQLRETTIHTGGGNTFTNVAPYVDIPDFLTKLDFSDWNDMEWFFEATLKAGTGTGKVRLYNVTDAVAVTESEVTTTSTSYVSVRSGSIPKPSGVKTYVVQYGHTPSGGGGDYINLTICRHIFRRPA